MKLVRALSLLAAALAGVAAQPALADPQRAQVAELKTVYLTCEQAASRTLLDMAAAAFCSRYAEELLQRGFAGDFNQLLSWWREAKDDAVAVEGGRPDTADAHGAAPPH
ncbi:hypothetical protein [Variovorax sp. YR216]|uniref:hypothetical protein n=1 Tax=Variovorax sp. YR216 TaxID=1882828 RepID=UPI000899D5FC|nr:hypothetical protein [Variovorax sp. YR216]SEA44163.1 hypothetical protein SAMN05444680_102416 [Variovorax sp. YR216]